mmetsp:Transcript_38736/g.124301  ORF Transcript_38736/g.124301 Transcript_38736/m.124301 type:complete len:236 (-) Transcript_38736:608-1315(-)
MRRRGGAGAPCVAGCHAAASALDGRRPPAPSPLPCATTGSATRTGSLSSTRGSFLVFFTDVIAPRHVVSSCRPTPIAAGAYTSLSTSYDAGGYWRVASSSTTTRSTLDVCWPTNSMHCERRTIPLIICRPSSVKVGLQAGDELSPLPRLRLSTSVAAPFTCPAATKHSSGAGTGTNGTGDSKLVRSSCTLDASVMKSTRSPPCTVASRTPQRQNDVEDSRSKRAALLRKALTLSP